MEAHKHSGCCSHCATEESSDWKVYLRLIFSLLMLIGGMLLQRSGGDFFRLSGVRLGWFFIGWLPVSIPVMKEAWETMCKKDFFNEFTLMLLASIGAFYIGEYPEALAVMLFYAVGEMYQDKAGDKARDHIQSLLDVRSQTATVFRGGSWQTVHPESVQIGEEIEVKAGERVPLDGKMIGEGASFNTAALTGESVPRRIELDGEVLAGMIPTDRVVRLRAMREYTDSALARILDMVQTASSRKAPTEQFIRKFARVYTPAVTLLAVLLVLLPWVYSMIRPDFVYDFQSWLYRALVFLVISCPCALVVSIPLGYFSGIGSASRFGILFKGRSYLDAITHVDTVVFDKTGTLTRGVFRVQEVHPVEGFTPEELVGWTAAAEAESNHPIARAVGEYASEKQTAQPAVRSAEELAGLGLRAQTDKGELLVGKPALLLHGGVSCPEELAQIPDTIVVTAVGGRYAGYLWLADEPKEDAARAVKMLNALGLHRLCILSGDKSALVKNLAEKIGIPRFYGDLMPEDKVRHIEEIQRDAAGNVAFVGDGLNDAPVLAVSRVGIAMGGLGSDVAIEAADVILQTDQPSKIATAIRIARHTRTVVWQNIIGAIGVKLLVLILGALGVATLWEAVFADVGVALLAILNALRLLADKKD
ncbi:MAG: cadmium-translocating P-type ATPase [Paraprevotella sp.]|nr:cadmium-translocating P-type ATPase [Paraprevotella sp.]